MMKHFKIHTPY